MTIRMNPARIERDRIGDLFLEYGPDAPTLCAGWRTRDLAAHLVVRDRRPDAAAGILISRLAAYGDRIRTRTASGDWSTLVDTVRRGPPRFSPLRLPLLDRLANTVEFFVHVEDVRRAQPNYEPRILEPAVRQQLLWMMKRGARLLTRSAPCGLIVHPTGELAITAKKGNPAVTISGDIAEIVLFLYGRGDHAHVDLTGPEDLVAAVRATTFGV